jgi:hypothetical protein
MFFEEYMNHKFFGYLTQCGVITVQSFGSHILSQPSGLGLRLHIWGKLTLTVTAVFLHVISLPQVTMNLVAQVTLTWPWDGIPLLPSPPCHSCRMALDTVSIDTISFNIVYVACPLAISYMNIFPFFDKLIETFKFWFSGCHVKGPLLPPSTLWYFTKSCAHQVTTRGAVTWQDRRQNRK